ncbi:MAG: DUF4097 family beta strand repeat-containing protein [Spirochaetales bacterium]|uniref:DUF4097 family beta strand repeat-containing protein n=1 Tax=Candidatus Thalassospirochaeta sargassi TaxID=3119039 RepID=A0AAJ1IC99_9SPIO|nr:DUF4097 family beta strand repeat-containing protein [Spirochaetales bacterium]
MKRSALDLANILGFLIVLAIAAFAFYSLFIDEPFYKASSYTDQEHAGEGEESGTYNSNTAITALEIGNVSGRIEVESWSGDTVQLDYIKRGPGRHPDVKIDKEGSELTIKAVYPRTAGNFGSVDFFLKVPADIDNIEAGSVSGGIKIQGLSGTVKQKLSSTSGAVSTDSAGDLDISSVSGSLSFVSSGTNIKASTTSGRIEGELKEASSSTSVKISSVSGRLLLDVPSGLNAEVDLHSVSGSVSSDIPVAVTETRRNSIRGTIGSGGALIEMSTVSGAVKITK